MIRLKNKTVLVTGAASGIGRAIALLFAQEGARVAVTDIDDEKGQRVVAEIGDNAVYFHLDVSSESEWKKVMDKVIKQFGRLDILINNAGIIGLTDVLGPQDPEHESLKSWDFIHRVNSDSVFLGCREAIRVMKNNGGGSIVNLSSRSGMVGIPGAVAYASSKASIRNHTKSVALYCASENYNIRCNSIHPGAILTPIWDAMLGEGEQRQSAIETMEENIPLKTMGEPIDVAYAALYLASDESKYVTGIELTIDGGILAGSGASPKPADN